MINSKAQSTIAALAALFTLLLVVSCSSPAGEAQGAKGGSLMWQENCSRCHNFRDPGTLSDAQWEVAMRHMKIRGGLTTEEHDGILQFLQAGN
jgi:hypothetical protein